MSWLEKILPRTTKSSGNNKKEVPEGVWAKCSSCDAILYKAELEKSHNVCPKCDHHMRISARQRLEICLLYTSPSPRDRQKTRMPSSA